MLVTLLKQYVSKSKFAGEIEDYFRNSEHWPNEFEYSLNEATTKLLRAYFASDFDKKGQQAYFKIIQDINIGKLAREQNLGRLVHLEEVFVFNDRYMLQYSRPELNL